MENGGYLFAAYGIIWALFFGYIVYLLKRQSQLKREIEALKAETAKAEEKA